VERKRRVGGMGQVLAATSLDRRAKMGGMRANGKTCDGRKARGRYLQMC
jgi:hypothetical protein